jgi:hypothetical protein
MSNFNDKALRGVADAVSKIMDEELKGNQHKIDANKNGKIDAHDFKLLRAKKTIKEDDVGYQHRYSVKNGKATVHNPAKGEKDEPHHVYADSEEHAVRKHAAQTKPTVKEEVKKNEYHIAGKHKFPTKDEHAVTVKHTESGREHVHSGKGKYLSKLIKSRYDINHHFESVELDEAFPTVADGEKSLRAKEGKTSSGTVTKTKTGLVHKRDYKDDDNGAEDMQKKPKAYGARQNFKRSTRVNEQLSFTEMLHLYNEHGIEVINKIFPQTVKFGDTEVELIDANEVNGVVGITVAEEVDNETFTKEVEAQKEKNAGRGKKAEVAKASVQAVEVQKEEAEQIDEISSDLAGKYLTAPQGKGANKYKVGMDKSVYPNYDAMSKHDKSVGRALQRSGGQAIYKKPDYYKEEEQLDEISKGTLGSYIKAASHDVATKGALTRHFADKSRREKEEKKGWEADKSMKKADKTFAAGWKRRQNMAKAVDRLTKEEVQLDERTLTPSETAKKEDNVMGMKKSFSGFKARYGDDAKSVMYATATKMAKKD